MATINPGDGALGFFLPAAIANQVQKWRRRFDPNSEAIAPHITLAYPPFVPASEWHAARQRILDALSAFRPFSVTLKALDSFGGESSVLWLKPEDNGVLAQMRLALQQQFPDAVPVSPLGYVPHVSIGFFDSDQAMAQARRIIEAELKPLLFKLEVVNYMTFRDDGAWHLVDHFPLGNLK